MNDARFYRASLVVAPALLLASSLPLTALYSTNAALLRSIAEQPDRYYLWCLFGVLASLALLPACWGLALALRPHRSRTAVAGAVLTITGAAFSLVDMGTELVKWQAGRTGTDVAAMTALLDRVDASPGVNAILQTSGQLFLVGFVVFGIGLRRARLVPLWVAVGLPVGLFVNLFGFVSNSVVVLDAGAVVLLVVMAAAGRALAPDAARVHPSTLPVVA